MPKGPIHSILGFPLEGQNTAAAHENQPENTSPAMLNVRAFDTFKGKARGGSRSGFQKAITDAIGSGNEVRMLSQVTSMSDYFSGVMEWWDDFDRVSDELGPDWQQAPWTENQPSTTDSLASAIYGKGSVAAVLIRELNLDVSEPYTVEMSTIPYNNEYHAIYSLYLKMDDADPDFEDAGIKIDFQLDSDDGSWEVDLVDNPSGSDATTENLGSGSLEDPPLTGQIEVLVNGQDISVFFGGDQVGSTVTVSASAGDGLGFGLDPQQTDWIISTGYFRVHGQGAGAVRQPRTTMLVASANGRVYSERTLGTLEECPTENVELSDDIPLDAAPTKQKLFIADWSPDRVSGTGDIDSDGESLTDSDVDDFTDLDIDTDNDLVILADTTGDVEPGNYEIDSVSTDTVTLASSAGGSGTAYYRIGRAPKVYDPVEDELSLWKAQEGNIPMGCEIVERYRGRMILARSQKFPHLGYMSRTDDPYDFDVGQDDPTAASAWQGTEFGTIGEPITAVAAWGDDFLVVGCSSDIWIMLGDPSHGGRFYNVSRREGILSNWSWCFGPSGEMYFIGEQGFYRLPPGSRSRPEPLSLELLPRALQDIDTTSQRVHLVYNSTEHGVNIAIEDI
ncbi:MAG: hypothetical protein ACOCSQ_03420 [Planctomycetota bacterium]